MDVKISNCLGEKIRNTFNTICVWDFRDFEDDAFGGMPEGWYKSQYPFIEYVILMTFTGGKGYNEWCTVENGVLKTDFTTPIRILKNVLRQGVKPLVVIGNVPTALSDDRDTEIDSFGWGNRCPPADYDMYYEFIKEFAVAIKEAFDYEIYKDFIFRVGTEADNFHWLLSSEEEYLKLYDYTVAALTDVLGDEIKIGPTNLERVERFPNLLRHCAEGVNYYTGKIGTKCDFFSISHYELGNPIISYKDYAPKMKEMYRRVSAYPQLNISDINVGEGGFISDGMNETTPHRLKMAQDCTEYGASWLVQNFAQSLEIGASYFANWAYSCDYQNLDEQIIKCPAHFAAQLCYKLTGLPALKCEYSAPEDDAVYCLSAINVDEKKLYVLLCNHHLERGVNSPIEVTIKFDGINPSKNCTLYRVDKEHNNFSAEWLEISRDVPRIEGATDFDILGSVVETEIWMTLDGEGLALWKEFKKNFKENELVSEKISFSNDFELSIPSYGVALLEFSI